MDKALQDFEEELLRQAFWKYNINSGGCAKAAYAFYKYFLPIKGIKVKGAIVLNWCSFYSNKKSLINIANNTRDIIRYCNHVVLVFEHQNKQYVIDAAEGIQLKEHYLRDCNELGRKVITGYLRPKLLKQIANSPVGWNDMFNVYHLKHLRKFLKETPLNV